MAIFFYSFVAAFAEMRWAPLETHSILHCFVHFALQQEEDAGWRRLCSHLQNYNLESWLGNMFLRLLSFYLTIRIGGRVFQDLRSVITMLDLDEVIIVK